MRRSSQDISEFSSATKMEDSSCPTENRCRKSSSQEDRDSTVTVCKRNDAIRDQTHEAGKDLQRARYSQSGCCQDCQRSSQRSRRQRRCRRKPNTAEAMETSRAARGKQQDCDSVEQHPSVQDRGAPSPTDAEAYKRATSMSQTVSTSIPLRTSAILKRKTSAIPKLT